MNTLPDFFNSVTGLSELSFAEHFDELLALYYVIGRGTNAQVSYLNSDPLQLSFMPKTEIDRHKLTYNNKDIRIMHGKRVSFEVIDDNSIIVTLK